MTNYLHRCIAVAARYWAAWWAAILGERAGNAETAGVA